MQPGPNYVYKCPRCGNLLTVGSILSGNTIGAKIYSDGKRIAPMLPDFPDLTKCKKCETIFWLSKLRKIGRYEWGDKMNSKWAKADEANFLGIDDYFRALSENVAENVEEELFIRNQVWWAYNDRKRDNKSLFTDEHDQLMWWENCHKLISLLDQADLEQKIMTAEIYRNLGEFDTCIRIIQSIDNDDLKWLKEKFMHECDQKNTYVIRLN